MATNDHRHAVILAGGRGVRFWPHSRAAHPKQLLSPLGGASLLRRTYERLRAAFPEGQLWVVTGASMREAVERELPELSPARIIAEPVQRNTAPAIGLATALVLREDPEAVMGVFPADHHIEDEEAYRELVSAALGATDTDRLIVLGIQPTRPETGYGYIEFPPGTRPGSPGPVRVTRFCEKPDLGTANRFLASGRFFWNSGQFFWRASVLGEEMRRHLPRTWSALSEIAGGAAVSIARLLGERYGECESVSVDRAILERSDRVAGFAAGNIGWTDLGTWESLRDLLPRDTEDNCDRTGGTFVRSRGNYVDVPGRHVVLLGASDLIVVEAPDALLICRRSECQNLSDLEQALRKSGRGDLL